MANKSSSKSLISKASPHTIKKFELIEESVLLFERGEVQEKAVEKCDFDKVAKTNSCNTTSNLPFES